MKRIPNEPELKRIILIIRLGKTAEFRASGLIPCFSRLFELPHIGSMAGLWKGHGYYYE